MPLDYDICYVRAVVQSGRHLLNSTGFEHSAYLGYVEGS